ncbi:MAG: PASTA domain-containing protein [Candidatus Xenobia bacterium]
MMRFPITSIVVWLCLASLLPTVPSLRPWASAPALVGLPTAQARVACARAGLQLSVAGKRWEHNRPADRVLEQFPIPGRHLLRGASVAVLLNEPTPRRALPDVCGHDEARARQVIVAAGYRPQLVSNASERVPFGRVIDQTALPGGRVQCLISSGPERRTVHDLTGMALGSAREAMARLSLSVMVGHEQPSAQPAGTVLSQQPAPGSRLPPHGLIVVTLSQGAPKPLPSLVGLPLWEACLQAQQAGLVATVDNSNAPGPRFVAMRQRRDAASPDMVHLQVEAPP